MRLRLDLLATAGLLVVPITAMVIFGAADDPAPLEVPPEEPRAPAPKLTPTSTPERFRPSTPRTPPRRDRVRPTPSPRRRPVANDESTDPGPTGDLWPDAKRREDDSPGGQAAALFNDEKYAEAILTAQSCLASDPDNESCKTTLLRSYLKTEAYRQARKTLDACLAANPEDLLCLGHKMNMHVRRGRKDQALEVAQQLMELSPDGKWGRLAARVAAAAE